MLSNRKQHQCFSNNKTPYYLLPLVFAWSHHLCCCTSSQHQTPSTVITALIKFFNVCSLLFMRVSNFSVLTVCIVVYVFFLLLVFHADICCFVNRPSDEIWKTKWLMWSDCLKNIYWPWLIFIHLLIQYPADTWQSNSICLNFYHVSYSTAPRRIPLSLRWMTHIFVNLSFASFAAEIPEQIHVVLSLNPFADLQIRQHFMTWCVLNLQDTSDC